MRKYLSLLAAMTFLTLVAMTYQSQAADKVDLEKVPEKVMSAVKTRFPGAESISVTKEVENGDVVYDVELKHKDRKYEMDIKEDGTILEVEKQVDAKDFPAACAKAVETKYPKSTVKEIMEVNKVKDKVETPDHYEVTIETTEKKSVEVLVSLKGEIIEETK